MADIQDDGSTHLAGDLGDVLAIVERPEAFRVPERSWKHEAIFEVAADAARFSPALGIAAGGAALVLLAVRGAQQAGAARKPHVLLMAVGDARALVARDTLFFPHGG